MHKINASSFTTHRTRDLLLSFNNFAVKLKTKQTIFASFQIANMSLKLGDQFPNFALKPTQGEFQLHDWLGNRFAHRTSPPSFHFFFFLAGEFYSHIRLITPRCVQPNYLVQRN